MLQAIHADLMSETPQRPRVCDGQRPDDTRSLTAAIAQGDDQAFGVVYDRWFPRCLSLARRLTGRDEAFCLDVVQDAMLRMIKKAPLLEHEGQLSVWLFRVVHTTALDALRQERRRTERERRRRGGPEASEVTDPDRIEWIRDQLKAIDAEDAGLLRLRYEHDLAKAGEMTSISKDAAHGRVRRVLHTLRARASEYLR